MERKRAEEADLCVSEDLRSSDEEGLSYLRGNDSDIVRSVCYGQVKGHRLSLLRGVNSKSQTASL